MTPCFNRYYIRMEDGRPMLYLSIWPNDAPPRPYPIQSTEYLLAEIEKAELLAERATARLMEPMGECRECGGPATRSDLVESACHVVRCEECREASSGQK
jgi:hypothetical protein